jgi:uncharacterized protein with ACT and thioredoxin-like domain
MYDDRAHLRDNPIKSRFNDDEYEAVKAVARMNKMQPAVYIRSLVMQHITGQIKLSREAHAA